jgi:hypothetical protein
MIDEPEMKIIEESTIDFTNTPTPSAGKTCVQSSSRRRDYSEKYKKMTPEQREARRVRQRLYNREPRRKEALKLYNKKFEEKRKHTLHPDSIAMENPLFSPKLVWPNMDTPGATGSMSKSSDRVVPGFFGPTPIYIPPPHEEPDDERCDELLPRHMKKRTHAPSGQRHALLTCRIKTFERRIGSNTKASHKEGDCMAEDRVDADTPLPQSAMTNNCKC